MKTSSQAFVPWVALAISIFALVISLVALLRPASEQPQPVLSGALPVSPMLPGGVLSGTPPDLSTMTPRQAADRLFNRVMTANENGNTAEATRFAPMALQAYKNLGTLDNDAQYHVALIHLATGDTKGARAQADQLLRSAPNNLLGIMVEHDLAQRSGDKKAAAGAYKKFLAAYDAEIAKPNIEYQDHESGIQRFRDAAIKNTAGK